MKKLTAPLMSFWHCLTSVGGSGDVIAKDRKYIKFTNIVAVLTAVSVFIYIPFSLLRGYYLLGLLQGADALCVLLVLWFNHLGYYKSARHLYILVVNSFVLINSCFIGYESRVQDFFYIAYIVPFLLFNVKDYKNIIVGVLTSIVFFYLYQQIYSRFEMYNLDINSQHLIYTINLWMKFVLFGIAIYILSYYNHITESELAASNLKLQDQAVELKRSNDDLEQFAAIISHDLKEPVRNVSGFMTLMKRRYAAMLDSDALNLLDMSKSSADRMSRQIDDLLAYSKLGRDLPPAGSVDLSAQLATIVIELGEKIKEKNAQITIDRQMPVLRHVHEGMIHHVFQNLITNAIKFNINARPEVHISCVTSEDDHTFCIADNGIGIDPIYGAKIFQMFRRLHSDSEFEGSGIGLAVCRKIIDYYGGHIWFESSPGAGTKFYVRLLRRRPEAQVYAARFAVAIPSHYLSVS